MTNVLTPRAVCLVCERPASVCLCAHMVRVPSKTRVVVLQHPRETDMAIGTARLATRCLENAELHVGISFENDAAVRAAISDPERPAALLWPGPGAVDVLANPPAHPITLVVVDGTWPLAKKLVRLNPALARLPRYAFAPPAPSEYRIRREPRDSYVSTLEAIVHVLSALEGDAETFRALLAPFRAMIDIQIEHQQRLHGARHLHHKGPKPSRLPSVLRERPSDLVCVHAEANAWPYDEVEAPDELVQWVACRVTSGESFSSLVRPSGKLAPATPVHTRLDAHAIAAAPSFAEMSARFAEFLLPTDVLCAWGGYAPGLYARQGGTLPSSRLDLRAIAGAHLGRKPGAMLDLKRTLGIADEPPLAEGRAGARLADAVSITRHFARLADGR